MRSRLNIDGLKTMRPLLMMAALVWTYGLESGTAAALDTKPFIVIAPDQESDPPDLGPGVKALTINLNPGGPPTTQELNSFFAYDPGFTGGVRVATGDVNGDGTPDIITGAGPGGGPHVRVFDGKTGGVLTDLPFTFDAAPGFTGGVFVAAGDVNNDGRADIITGAGAGGGPHVKVFSGQDNSVLQEFFAYDPAFAGGVFVAAGDINGDGRADIITGPGAGGGPNVRVFDGQNSTELASFFAYDESFTGGVHVSTDANFISNEFEGGDAPEIITSPASDSAGVPVRFFAGFDNPPNGIEFFPLLFAPELFPYGTGFAGGVRVAAVDLLDDPFGFPEIITIPGPGTDAEVRVFSFTSNDPLPPGLDSFFAFDAFAGGVFVGGALPNGLAQAFQGGGFIAAANLVPEPASGLAVMAGLVLAVSRRRRAA